MIDEVLQARWKSKKVLDLWIFVSLTVTERIGGKTAGTWSHVGRALITRLVE